MAEFEPWRSREILWVKPRTDRNGAPVYVTRDGKTIPAEALKRSHERLEGEAPK